MTHIDLIFTCARNGTISKAQPSHQEVMKSPFSNRRSYQRNNPFPDFDSFSFRQRTLSTSIAPSRSLAFSTPKQSLHPQFGPWTCSIRCKLIQQRQSFRKQQLALRVIGDEWILEQSVDRQSFLRILLQTLPNKRSQFDSHIRRKVNIRLHNALIGLKLGLIFKGRLASDQLKGQNAQTPHIYLEIMGFPKHHLRRQVIQRSANSVPPAACVNGPSEVSDLHLASRQQQVLRLDVSIQASPYMTCFRVAATRASLNLPIFLSLPQSSPSGACQRMRQTELLSQKQPYNLRMCGWLSADWMMISRLTCSVKLHCSISCLPIRFNATTYQEAFSLATNTSPNLPFPRT